MKTPDLFPEDEDEQYPLIALLRVLVNRLGGQSLPRKSVTVNSLTDRLDVTIMVYKAVKPHNNNNQWSEIRHPKYSTPEKRDDIYAEICLLIGDCVCYRQIDSMKDIEKLQNDTDFYMAWK